MLRPEGVAQAGPIDAVARFAAILVPIASVALAATASRHFHEGAPFIQRAALLVPMPAFLLMVAAFGIFLALLFNRTNKVCSITHKGVGGWNVWRLNGTHLWLYGSYKSCWRPLEMSLWAPDRNVSICPSDNS